MKKRVYIIGFIFICFVALFSFAGCENKPDYKYKISYIVDEKSYFETGTNGNTPIEMPEEPEKTGYEFKGWYYNNKEFDFENYQITQDIQLIAHWTLTDYFITYIIPEYATNSKNQEIYHINNALTLHPAESETKTFMGWYKNQDFSDSLIKSIPQGTCGDIVLYAKFKDIEKTTEGYKTIKEVEDLDLLRLYPEETIVLGNDIDLNYKNFVPIPSFSGVLDGKNYKIKRMKIHGVFDKVGFIQTLTDGVIQNLGIENFDINCANTQYAGTFAGSLTSYSTIKNCYSSGNIKIKAKGSIYCGGLIGYSTGSNGYTISNCFTNSNIQVKASQSTYVGGLVGYFSYTELLVGRFFQDQFIILLVIAVLMLNQIILLQYLLLTKQM